MALLFLWGVAVAIAGGVNHSSKPSRRGTPRKSYDNNLPSERGDHHSSISAVAFEINTTAPRG